MFLTLLIANSVWLIYFLIWGGFQVFAAFAILFQQARRYPGQEGELPPGEILPLTLLVPAWKEEVSIVASVQKMLQVDYPQLEVLVVCDGSPDRTLEVLQEAFALQESVPFRTYARLRSQPVQRWFTAPTEPRLRVCYKQNGGKADSLNAGLNYVASPLVAALDSDTLLARNSLKRLVEPLLQDPEVVATGGTVYPANELLFDAGSEPEAWKKGPRLVEFQTLEYARAFLMGRFGWNITGAVLIISGAFGVFRREAVVTVGGWDQRTIGEDFELTLRLIGHYPKGVRHVPEATCWTDVPETGKALRAQRMRWHQGLLEALQMNPGLRRHPRLSVRLVWLYFWCFEAGAPWVVVLGILWTSLALWLVGSLAWLYVGLFFLSAYVAGTLTTGIAIITGETYGQGTLLHWPFWRLVRMSLLEPLLYQPVTLWWRIKAAYRDVRGHKGVWVASPRQGFKRK